MANKVAFVGFRGGRDDRPKRPPLDPSPNNFNMKEHPGLQKASN